jgi:dihydropyrimidine dehydrogenase (NAD+) subunit PreA
MSGQQSGNGGNGNAKKTGIDISVNTGGIRSPNPFWLASGPPANSGDQVMRAFDAGWGGAVWKTLGDPIVNVSSRYGGLDLGGQRVAGLNNIELITDRPLEDNLREIALCKKKYPNHAVIASLMVESKQQWKDIIKRTQDTGCDGFELNFGCPHGMCERGMGSAVGSEPAVCQEITSWAKEFSKLPVLVKLTPGITDITDSGVAAAKGGADGVSLINTIKSLMGVDIDRFVPYPRVGTRSTNGGYCGPAVKPIALYMVGSIYNHPEIKVPISGIGGVSNWRDAVEFILMGSTSVQVCTAVMHYGFRIVEDMIEGLTNYMREKGFHTVDEFVGKAARNFTDWGELDMNYKVVADIDASKCIGCQLCHVACWDGAHQCIHVQPGSRVPVVDEHECIGCNLCNLVCPVPNCITMREVDQKKGSITWNEIVKQGR